MRIRRVEKSRAKTPAEADASIAVYKGEQGVHAFVTRYDDGIGSVVCRLDFTPSEARDLAAMLLRHADAAENRHQVTRDLIVSTSGGPAWTVEGDPSRGAAGQWRAVGPWRDERAHADGDARGGLGFHRRS